MSAAERARFKKEWKQHAHQLSAVELAQIREESKNYGYPRLLCRLCQLGERIGQFVAYAAESEALAAGRAEPARETRISEDAEVERVAAKLARLNKTQLEIERERVRKLLDESKVTASVEHQTMREEIESRGSCSDETLETFISAKLKPKMIPYESLISKAPTAKKKTSLEEKTKAGEKAIPIVNPFWNKNSDSDTARIATWTKLTKEGFDEAVDKFVTHETATMRKQIDLQLAKPKKRGPAVARRGGKWVLMFAQSPTFLSLIDSVREMCEDVPFVARFANPTQRAIEIAKEFGQPRAAIRAKRMVFRIISNAGLHDAPTRRKQLLDLWEEEARAHRKDAIIQELNKQRSLPSSIVWQINESRQRGASMRSKHAAETKASKKQAS
jgi:hypothetical protein